MNAPRMIFLPCGAAFRGRHLFRHRWPWLLAWLLFPPGLTSARAETLYTLSGWIEAASRPYSTYGEYVLMNDPLDRVRAVLSDPDYRFMKEKDPGRYRLQAAITQPRGPGDEPVFRIVAQETAAVSSSSPDVTGNPGWAALTNDLYAADMNVVPRLASFTGDDYPDADGDGTPDNKDAFPGRPEEWHDTDNDGKGNNADLDDDGDGMSDAYELLNGLNPLLADATGDADGDGADNGQEAIAGTRANDRSSIFTLTIAPGAGPGVVTVQWQVSSTRIYVLEAAASPAGPWLPVLPGFRPRADAVFSHTVPSPFPSPLFLRAVVSIP